MKTIKKITPLLISFIVGIIIVIGFLFVNCSNLKQVSVSDNSLFLSTNSPNYHQSQVLGSMIARKYDVPENIITEIEKYDWDPRMAKAIMMAESHGKPKEQNMNDYHPSGNCRGSFGLFQLACFRGNYNELVDPKNNIRLAYELWKEEYWHPWGAYNNKSYLKFYYEAKKPR